MDCKIVLKMFAIGALFLISCPYGGEGYPHPSADSYSANLGAVPNYWRNRNRLQRMASLKPDVVVDGDNNFEKSPPNYSDDVDGETFGDYRKESAEVTQIKKEETKRHDDLDNSVIPLQDQREYEEQKNTLLGKYPATVYLWS